MIVFDKQEIRESLTIDNIFNLLQDFGGDPEYSNFGILSHTICHNRPGEGSQKLYYYSNSDLFTCYTGCEEPVFDIFELVIKIKLIQEGIKFDLNDAVRWVAQYFGLSGKEEENEENRLSDWKYFSNYEQINNIALKNKKVELKEYNKDILDRFNYKVKIDPWLKEGISQESIQLAKIGYYPGGEQITIPHFDKDERFVGLRGRTLVREEAEKYGKYRPLKINGQLYNHPLGFSLYGLNWAKDNIKKIHKALIFESEKSVLQFISAFGKENDIAVACCGSNISEVQMNLLLDLNVNEIIIAFDKQYKQIGDEEYYKWIKKLKQISLKYSKNVLITFLFDTKDILSYKSSPIDEGREKFLYLYKNRLDENGRTFK